METPKLIKAFVKSTLIQENWISKDKLETLLVQNPKKPIAEVLISQGILSKQDLQKIITSAKTKAVKYKENKQKDVLFATPTHKLPAASEMKTVDFTNPQNAQKPLTPITPQTGIPTLAIPVSEFSSPEPSHSKAPPTITSPISEQPTLSFIDNPPANAIPKTVFMPEEERPAPPKTIKMDNPKQQFGKYEVIEKLAQGAMGIVYKVRHTELRSICALKVIISGEDATEEAITRFYREAKTTAKLKHPNIVQVLDSGQEGKQHYFVMEYIEGKTLDELIEQRPPIKKAVQIIKKCLEALHQAHQQGIIHRDLKPSNIFITKKGEPKIGDFGLAKDVSRDTETKQLTHAGAILGTPAYMPPEQAAGEIEKLDARADIYSIGACLYQLLTNRCPFDGSNLHELFYNVLTEDITPPSKFNSKIHKDLETIVLKSLERIRTKRYQSSKAFAADLGRYLKGYPIQAKASTSMERFGKWLKRNYQLVAIFLLVVFSGISFYAYSQWQHHQQKQRRLETISRQATEEREKAKETKEKREVQFEHLLNALNLINIALAIQPNSFEFEKQKQEIGEELIKLACEKKEFTLAKYLAKEVNQLSIVEENQENLLKEKIEKSQNETLKKHQARLEFWLEKLRTGNYKSGQQDDAIFEISKMTEKPILASLLKILEEGTTHFQRNWAGTPVLNRYYNTITIIIGRMENLAAEDHLIQSLLKMERKLLKFKTTSRPLEANEFMIKLAQAIGNLNSLIGMQKLKQTYKSMGENSSYSQAIEYLFQKSEIINATQEAQENNKETSHQIQDYIQKGEDLKLAGDYKGALEALDHVLEKDPNLPEAYNKRGKVKHLLKDFQGALQDFNQSIRLRRDFPGFYNNRALTQEALKNFQGSFADYGKAIKLDKRFKAAYVNRANLNSKFRKFEEAIKDYSKAIQIDPQFADCYYNRASIKRRMRNYSEAIKDYNKAIGLNPQIAEAYNGRGQCYEKLNVHSNSLKDFETCIMLAPKFPKVYFNRAKLKEKLQDYVGAIQDFNEAIRLDPNTPYFYANRGLCKQKLGEPKEAEKDFLKAIQLDPSFKEKLKQYRKK